MRMQDTFNSCAAGGLQADVCCTLEMVGPCLPCAMVHAFVWTPSLRGEDVVVSKSFRCWIIDQARR